MADRLAGPGGDLAESLNSMQREMQEKFARVRDDLEKMRPNPDWRRMRQQ